MAQAAESSGPVGDLAVLGGKALGPHDPAMVGRYRIHALLGIGGMGRVYLGWAPDAGFGSDRSGAWVAVKVIRPDLADDPEFRSRFARELEAVGRVRTPYAAPLVHGEIAAQQPWMATEFVPGVSLADAVAPSRPLPSSSVWRLAHDLGSALVAVHQAELVHRDVKPSNVILSTGGAKLIDFGVAHVADLSQLTATGINVGTPGYMSPEQAKSGEVSPASDVFSLGVLLYFASSGRLPFGEGGTAEVLFRVVYEEPDVSGLDGLEPGLRDLVLRCIAKDPQHRPNAAGIVAMAEAAAAAGLWAAGQSAQWPEALAARISERTLAAGRTLPDPSLVEVSEYQESDIPPLFGPVDSEPTVFTGSADSGTGQGNRRRQGVLVATVSTVAVIALGVTALMLWGPGSSGSANASIASTATSTASGGSTTTSTASGSLPNSASASVSPSRSSTATTSGGASPSATPGSSSTAGAGGVVTPSSSAQQTSTTTSAAPTTASSPTSAGTANKYTPAEVCGSGFSVIDHHALTGATIYLLYNSSTGYNCVTTLATLVNGSVSMNATLAVQNGSSGSNPGSFTYYAGPVKEHAPSACVKWGGTYKSSSWTSIWSHCG